MKEKFTVSYGWEKIASDYLINGNTSNTHFLKKISQIINLGI